MTRPAVILFGHGSRDPAWREPMDALALRISELSPDTAVICAFLELQAPDFAAAMTELARGGADRVTVLPMFLGVGKHARKDLPRLVEAARVAHPGVSVHLLPSVGERADVLDLLANAVLQADP
ncbi:cobalamin biosynthesis protein CbiX [Ramlibacter henchirensis]|uniref:Cobalamin biosynthesis protein CbiX n=1 Tax=Ramlibacter henchirensis TaxID=204072 RepID=A0A4Z0BPX6_9BURK|nr:CbiX/SirB N-terminal domain-containing protein [Ramlibacter henchirensis]TFZ00822.1 cobalamin biosynthesis protein CbiX [Ramlibacter henchirensis]